MPRMMSRLSPVHMVRLFQFGFAMGFTIEFQV